VRCVYEEKYDVVGYKDGSAVRLVMPQFLSFTLYRFETNIRAAAILGFVGAGGIGFYV